MAEADGSFAPAGRFLDCAPFFGERERAAGEMWAAVEPCLPAFGITRVARVTGLDRIGIPVWNAVVPNARTIVVNQGKGLDDDQARLSAAMEAMERAVACDPRVETVHASRSGLRDTGVHAEPLLGLVAADQPDPDPDEATEWVPGLDLLAAGKVWVPLAAVSLDRTGTGGRYWQSSDGLAAGSCLREAIIHGILERIERDAEALWKVGALRNRCECCIEPACLDSSVLDELVQRIDRAKLRLRLFDVTTDIGVPSFTALIGPTNSGRNAPLRFAEVAQGNAAHPDRRRAAVRAVLEAAQSRLTYISGARDDISADAFVRDLPDDTRAVLRSRPSPGRREDGPLPHAGPAGLLEHLLGSLRSAGCERLIVVPLTIEGAYPFEVVKVFAPELEHADGLRRRRFGPRAISRSLLAG